MKTSILFYSYTGHTKKAAEELAAREAAELAEIEDVRRPGKVKAYVAGCFAAIKGKTWPVQPLSVDLTAYDRLILMSPVWAGNPPPAVNAVMERLPEGKTVAVKMISTSGKSGCRERVEAIVKAKNGILESFEDIQMK